MSNQEMVSIVMRSGRCADVTFTRGAGEKLAEAKRSEIEKDIRDFFEGQEKDEAGIWAKTSSLVISARNPLFAQASR